MNRGSCDDALDLLPEFALGTLTGSGAAEVVEHAARCGSCRARLADLTAVTDAVLHLAPEREPTPAFTARVTGAIRAEPTPARRSRRRVSIIAATAAAVALIAGGIAIGRATTAEHGRARTESSEIRERSMIGSGGRPAGNVFIYRGDPAWAVVSVDYGTLPPGEYAITTVGTRTNAAVGRVTVDGKGRGAWGGTLGDTQVHTVRIVDDAGHVLCEARFGPQSRDAVHS